MHVERIQQFDHPKLEDILVWNLKSHLVPLKEYYDSETKKQMEELTRKLDWRRISTNQLGMHLE